MTGDPDSGGRAGERIVAAILVFMAVVLGYLRFGFLPKSRAAPPQEFDLRNPMLDARLGETVEIEEVFGAGTDMTCVRVVEPGLVLRPAVGPEKLGDYDDLRRMRPYLACEVVFPERGKTCASPGGRRGGMLLYDLVGFGMPSRIPIEPHKIRPTWRRWSGKTHHAYEVEMFRYGAEAGPNVLWITDDAPVAGVVYRQYAESKGRVHQIFYRDV